MNLRLLLLGGIFPYEKLAGVSSSQKFVNICTSDTCLIHVFHFYVNSVTECFIPMVLFTKYNIKNTILIIV
jgi:hypothetical protein